MCVFGNPVADCVADGGGAMLVQYAQALAARGDWYIKYQIKPANEGGIQAVDTVGNPECGHGIFLGIG